MDDEHVELLSGFLATDTWRVYSKAMQELIDTYEIQADQEKVATEDRLWLLAKAQGVKDALRLPHIWLKRKSTR